MKKDKMRNVICALVVFTAGSARGDDFSDAKVLNAKARTLLEEGDANGALRLFEQAYALSPSPDLLLNIGTTFKRMGRNADAANSYQRYLDTSSGDSSRASEVRTLLAVLDTTVGRLAIDTIYDGELQIGDGPWIATSRASLLRVTPGGYVLHVRRGTQMAKVVGTISAGEQRAHELLLEQPAAVPLILPEARPEAVRPVRDRSIIVPATFVGAGAIALGAATYLGFRAAAAFDDAREICPRTCEGPIYEDSQRMTERGKRTRLGALALGGAGVIGIGAGLFLWLLPRGDASRVAVVAAPDELGLVYASRFW